ncbi:MAG: hypothetical protein JSR78_08590, partial [Proteobacteria bacterium]|nr:hypothetical protein [Pseudomonadota bacterium]
MADESEYPLRAKLLEIERGRDAAIEAHSSLRSSQPFADATQRTEKLVSDYARGLHAVSLMSTRAAVFTETRLSLRILDLLLESAIATLGLIHNGSLNPARREMRFLLEASIKAWWLDAIEPGGSVARKIAFLDDLGAARFREVI